MTDVTFSIIFHGPFHVLSGYAGTGSLDLTVDERNPLPGSSIKGVMRATASLVPGLAGAVDEVFGTPARPSLWHWGDAEFDAEPLRRTRSRIAIGDDGIVADGALVSFEEVWAESATLTIEQQMHEPDPARIGREADYLATVARFVRSVGADRNRGFGWVEMRPVNVPPQRLLAAVGNGDGGSQ
jgi:CRISPR/Cas system CSM-associated protein Csm3 (group 7 of RAMP superfamily)